MERERRIYKVADWLPIIGVIFLFLFVLYLFLTTMFKFGYITNEEKIAKIKECTSENLGIRYSYDIGMTVRSMSCCEPGEYLCKTNNLKKD